MQISYSPRFKKRFKKLPKEIQLLTIKKEELFLSNLFHSSLNTHKLTGELEGLWAFSINHRYRVIFEFIDKDNIWFHTVGGHEVYK